MLVNINKLDHTFSAAVVDRNSMKDNKNKNTVIFVELTSCSCIEFCGNCLLQYLHVADTDLDRKTDMH